jgi:glycosyltransferase involved in cell wall biosynthesis
LHPLRMGSPRKTLLFVTDVFPYPLDRGQHVRVHNVLEACAAAFDVTLLGPGPAVDADREHVERFVSRTKYLGPPPEAWGERAALSVRTALSTPGIPRPKTFQRYQPFVAALHEVKPASFDFIWAERTPMARLCAAFRRRTILDLDDLEHVKALRQLRVQNALMERLHSTYRYVVHRHLEVSWARQCLASIVCSEEDRQLLSRLGCGNAFVVPNAPASSMAWNAFSVPPARDPKGPLRVAFLGNVGAVANLDAIDFFADSILPLLRALEPEVVLDVVGPNASDEVQRRYASRVRFRGFVEDLGEALAEYDVLVAPLRFGGGTKLKVLDGMAQRIPVVTTSVGAEGLSLKHGEHVWLGETAEQIAEGIITVKRDSVLAARLTENAYAHVRERFSWEAIKDRLTAWLLSLSPRGDGRDSWEN